MAIQDIAKTMNWKIHASCDFAKYLIEETVHYIVSPKKRTHLKEEQHFYKNFYKSLKKLD